MTSSREERETGNEKNKSTSEETDGNRRTVDGERKKVGLVTIFQLPVHTKNYKIK